MTCSYGIDAIDAARESQRCGTNICFSRREKSSMGGNWWFRDGAGVAQPRAGSPRQPVGGWLKSVIDRLERVRRWCRGPCRSTSPRRECGASLREDSPERNSRRPKRCSRAYPPGAPVLHAVIEIIALRVDSLPITLSRRARSWGCGRRHTARGN